MYTHIYNVCILLIGACEFTHLSKERNIFKKGNRKQKGQKHHACSKVARGRY